MLGFIPVTLSSSDNEFSGDFPGLGFSSLQQTDVLAVVSPLLLLGIKVQDKYDRVNWVRTDISFFGCLLTMSHSDFVKCHMLHAMETG